MAILKLISNITAIRILGELKRNPSYTRELSEKLSLGESVISRKLRELERLGLVEASWKRRGEKTIREYSLAICSLDLKLVTLTIKIEFCSYADRIDTYEY